MRYFVILAVLLGCLFTQGCSRSYVLVAANNSDGPIDLYYVIAADENDPEGERLGHYAPLTMSEKRWNEQE